MVDPTAIVTGFEQIAYHPPHTVFVRQRWADDWIEVPFLYCLNARWSAAPDVSRAEFEWRFGMGMQPSVPEFLAYEPLELDRWYVLVQIPWENETLRWYGVFAGDDQRQLYGGLGNHQPNGMQHLSAFGLESLLDRSIVDRSYVVDSDSERVVPRGLPFNGGAAAKLQDDTKRGNRYKAENPETDERSLFCSKISATASEEWTGEQIAEYLLERFSPRDADGEISIQFELTGQVANLNDRPRIDAQDKSVKRLLDEIVDRRRLLGWCVQVAVSGSTETVQVRVFSFADTNITLQDGTPIEANDRQRALDFDAAFDVQEARLTKAGQHAVDRVRVTGARRVGCGTLDAAGGTSGFVAAWQDEDEAEWWSGASTWADYPDPEAEDPGTTDYELRNKLNEDARARHALRKVFTTYKLGDTFLLTGKTGSYAWCPKLNPDWSIDETVTEEFWGPGLRLLRELPLKAGFDYSESATDPTPERTATEADDPTPELLRPFAAIKDPDDEAYPYYWALDREYSDGVEQARITARMTTSDDAPEFQVIPNLSPWALAGESHIAGLPNTNDPVTDNLENPQVFDWRNMVVTIAIEFDARVEICWPRETPTIAGDVLRELVIDLGDDARLDYLLPGTMLEVSSVDPDTGERGDEFTAAESGGFVRDDRPRMQTIAETAYKWYSVERQAFELSYRQVTGHFSVGDLIVSTGAASTLEDVRTVITSVAWDLNRGMTSITTDYAELDVRGGL